MPTSYEQRRLWVLDQLDVEVSAYHFPQAYRIHGDLDLAALREALHDVVRRHEVLRTRFGWNDGEPVQIIAREGSVPFELSDLRPAPAAERETRLAQLLLRESRRPFDLGTGPLLRALCLRLEDHDHVLLLTFHHIITDAWSTGVFARDLEASYDARRAGHAPVFGPLAVQYADYAQWQRERLKGALLEKQLTYWKKQLAGAPSILPLPTDRQRPSAGSARGAFTSRVLPKTVGTAVHALGQEYGASSFMVLLAAFNALLYRYRAGSDLVVGSPITTRAIEQLEGLIGFFVNTLALRVPVDGAITFAVLLERVRETVLGAFEHADVPFDRVVEELAPVRDGGHLPYVNVMFLVESAEPRPPSLPGADVTRLWVHPGTSKADLTLLIVDRPSDLECSLEYNTDLFDAARMDRMLSHFECLLRAAVANPTTRIAGLPLLGPAEHRLLDEWNDTTVEFDPGWSVVDAIERRGEHAADAVAVEDERGSLTAAELVARARAVAARLQRAGIGRGDVVGVVAGRSNDVVATLAGVLSAGATFAPFDPGVPAERLAFMLADAGPRLVLADCRAAALISGHAAPVEDVAAFARPDPTLPWKPIAADPEDAAYLIYTSGSTGQPKGVLIPHRGLANLLQWHLRRFALGPNDAVLASTSYSFDPSIRETFWPLVAGARLVLARAEEGREPAYLLRTVAERGITVLEVVPTLLRALLSEPGVKRSLASVRHLICGGEVLGPELLAAFRERSSAQFHNLYGPAEAAVDVVAWSVPPLWAGSAVPIGRPIANTRAYVVDEDGEPTPIGVPGELYVGGANVGLGYRGRPDLTAERFVADRFSGNGMLYRTGDLVRYGPDGELWFLGRIDRQFKLRGVRIEPAEVEAALREHRNVRDAAVILLQDGPPASERLVAYVVPEGPPPGAAALRAFLATRLPDAMIPSSYTSVAAIPHSVAGKVDYGALPLPAEAAADCAAHREPQTPNERLVAHVWRELLGRSNPDREANFFDLGGHSLVGMQVVSRLRQATGVALSLRDLFDAPTVAGLARRIDAANVPEPQAPAVRAKRRPWETASDAGG